MEAISNTQSGVRMITGAIAMGLVGFVCGYFGPLWLLPDPGVGPLTAIFTIPAGVLIGTLTAIHSSMRGLTTRKFVYRMLGVALVFAAATLAIVVTQ
jgi:hypothetical protein